MALSSQTETSDGTLVLLDVSIEYFNRLEITVLFDGVPTVTGWSWVGATDKKIAFSPAVPNGVVVKLQRQTSAVEARHSFTGGAAFIPQVLDENFTQIVRVAQEVQEGAFPLEDLFNDLNMNSNTVTNLRDAVAPQEPVTKSQFDAAIAGVDQDAADAEAARIAAEAARDASIVAKDASVAAKVSAEAVAATAVQAALDADADALAANSALNSLLNAIGVTVQAYDADTAKTDVAQNFTAPQRSALQTDNDGSFDLALKQNFFCTTAGALTLTFTNHASGLSGSVVFVNASNHTVSAHATTKLVASDLAKLSATGTYRIDYLSNGTNAYCSVVGPYA